MSIQTYAAAAPTDHTASVIFALATPCDTPVMLRARAWVDQLVAASPASAIAFEFASNLAFMNELQIAMLKVHGATTSTAVQDATFGGLRGHVLVILAPPCRAPGSGIRGFAGATDVELAITQAEVEAANLGDLHAIGTEGEAVRMILCLLRGGKFLSVCLVPTATGAPLEDFARALSRKTSCLVYGSNAPLEFTADAAPRLGPADAVAAGQTYVAHAAVALEAKPGAFLPGAEFWYWPGSP